MNKTITTSAMTIIIVSIVGGAAFVAKPASASTALSVAPPKLPPGLDVPAQLPSAITDPNVLVAWIKLYNRTEPFSLWDGRTLTGRELAQFLLDEGIPVVWDVDGVCGGNSCSVHHWTLFGWVYEGQAPGVDPIYIRPALQTDPHGLLMVLAHEIFHRTEPFGRGVDTKFEEYWAFRIGTAVAPAEWPVFDGYDPMQSRGLSLWLRDNNLGAYHRLPAYPPGIAGLVVSAGEARPRSLSTDDKLRIQEEARLMILAADPANVAQVGVLPAWPGQGE